MTGVLALLLAAAGWAQDASCRGYSATLARDAAAYQVAVDAAGHHANLFGAANLLETEIAPVLAAGNKGVAFLSLGGLYGSNWVPGRIGSIYCTEPNVHQAVDLLNGGFGLGARFGPVGLFYVGSSTNGNAPGMATFRPISTLVTGMFSSLVLIGGPFLVSRDEGDLTGFGALQVDFLAGATFTLKGVTLRAGYIGTQGLYSNLTADQLKLFASAALTEVFSRYPYLAAGLRGAQLLRGKDGKGGMGKTTAFVRKLDYVAPGVADEQPSSLQTAHGGQSFQVRDGMALGVDLVARWKPVAGIHEASGVLYLGDERRENALRGEFHVGMTTVPTMRYVGVEGGVHPMANLDLEKPLGHGLVLLSIQANMNDPVVLAQFPAAVNAVGLQTRLVGHM